MLIADDSIVFQVSYLRPGFRITLTLSGRSAHLRPPSASPTKTINRPTEPAFSAAQQNLKPTKALRIRNALDRTSHLATRLHKAILKALFSSLCLLLSSSPHTTTRHRHLRRWRHKRGSTPLLDFAALLRSYPGSDSMAVRRMSAPGGYGN